MIDEMFNAGAHFGYSKRMRHPSTKKFIFTHKNKTDIIDLEKTYESLQDAKAFIEGLAKDGKTILFVGVKPESKDVIKEAASSIEMPYVTERWIGGTLSNFSEIKSRVDTLLDMRTKKEAGEFDKYTKKEQLLLEHKMNKLDRLFSGLVNLKKLPDALFVVDSKHEHIAIKEAQLLEIPVFGLCNSDCNIKEIEHPIVANDSAISSISFFTHSLVDAYKKALSSKNKEE